MKITLFPTGIAKTGEQTNIASFVENIRKGAWQEKVLAVRIEKNPETRKKLKLMLPSATLSGTFEKGKKDTDLVEHSGYIAVDFDNLGDRFAAVKDTLKEDPYTASVFTSAGGYGLCVIVKINPKKHAESFEGLSHYYFSRYKEIIDPACSNVSSLHTSSGIR